MLSENHKNAKKTNTMDKPFNFIPKKELAKLSARERQDYLVRLKKRRKQNLDLVVKALNHGVLNDVKTN